MALQGIDVSYAQGVIDWEKVKSDQVQFAILRAGFGREVSQKDKCFEQNYKECKRVGMPVGVYHYSYAQSVPEARVEAKACLAWFAGKTLEYPVFYDLEDNSMKHLGKAVLTQIALAFCEEIQKGGFRPGIYANKDWCVNFLDMTQLKAYPLWLAQYNTTVTYPGAIDMWQYTSSGKVKGIKGRVDQNECYTDLTAKSGEWIFQEGKWWYRHADGSYTKNGWEQIQGKWYYFDEKGWMKTGWIRYDNHWYCTEDNGAMCANTWKNLGGKWYRFDVDGKAHEGWYQDSDKRWYYLNPGTAEMLTGTQVISGESYQFSAKTENGYKEGQWME
ncbi:MAG: GH25 family lysozyme [Massiliimalia sp.]|jgi:GH25 family lysozyme M1 (1,4-beta-N-acetylmuramidase)